MQRCSLCRFIVTYRGSTSIIILIAFVFLFSFSFAESDDWNIKKSKHFIIHYQEGSRDYVAQVATKAERYYKSITDYLGFMRFDFWTWDERCKIYLYPSREDYLWDTNVASWSGGRVHVISKEIIGYVQRKQFLDSVLPHEIGHIIFREVVGFDKELPLWIDEAVAVLQEKDRQRYLRTAKELVEEGGHIPLEELSRIRSYEGVSPDTFYSESASIMDFLLEEFGRRRFIGFCRQLRDGTHWEQALLGTYGFDDLQELEEAWIAHLLN